MTNSESPENREHSENHDHSDHHDHHDHHQGWGRFRWFFVPLILIAIAAKGALVMWLWNALIPEIFHGPELQYLQAVGLMLLAKLLIGFKPGHGGRFGGHGRHGHHRFGKHWKFSRMSWDERCKLRDEMRKRCGK